MCVLNLLINSFIWATVQVFCGTWSRGTLFFFLASVVGEVKDIDWFDPRGEKILPNRQDISVSRTEDSSTLVIYKANMDNAGIYTCVAKDGEKEAQATVKVTIYRKRLQR